MYTRLTRSRIRVEVVFAANLGLGISYVGYCEYFAFYIQEHTHQTQTARHM